MIAILVVLAGAYGTHLLATHHLLGWSGLGPGPRNSGGAPHRARFDRWLAQAGLAGIRPVEFIGVVGTLAMIGGLVALVLFGAWLPALVTAAFTGTFPLAAYRRRRRTRMDKAAQAWPSLIEEIRVLTASAGRSVPQALFEAGAGAGRAAGRVRRRTSGVVALDRLREDHRRPGGPTGGPHRGHDLRDAAGRPRDRRERPRPSARSARRRPDRRRPGPQGRGGPPSRRPLRRAGSSCSFPSGWPLRACRSEPVATPTSPRRANCW